jgi:Tfp pilus assembly protein PilV
MDALRSIRSSSRARTNSERGFALISAIVLAVLYIALIELLLLDSARELAEARRFRARIVAATLAENGAELAAAGMLSREDANVNAADWQGTINGTMRKLADNQFEITGDGTTAGVVQTSARVRLYGRIVGNDVRIQYSMHNP